MREQTSAHRRRFVRARRLVAGAAAATTLLALAPGAVPAGGDPVRLAAKKTCAANRAFQVVQANVKAGMTKAQTKADLKKVFKDQPDFVTLNEVAGRADSLLAPAGYGIWRTPGRYTGANPVVWRTDRWNPVAKGTIYVTNVGGKTKNQTTELGLRYANWVTVRSADGCQTLSVVSYHVAPKTQPIGNLLIPSVEKLGGLATHLATEGPVILGGDMNQHIKGPLYPRDLLTSYRMTPTWDLTGKVLVTHGKATIDHIFVRNASQFTVAKQVTRDLNSDHHAVVADLVLKPGVTVARPSMSFIRGHVVNIPDSPISAGRRAVTTRVLKAVRQAPAGSTILLATARLDGPGMRNALVAAHQRGVKVRVVSWSAKATTQEQLLQKAIGGTKGKPSFMIRRSYSKAAGLPATAVLFTSSAGVKLLGIQVDQPLNGAMNSREARGEFTVERADFVRIRDGIRVQFK